MIATRAAHGEPTWREASWLQQIGCGSASNIPDTMRAMRRAIRREGVTDPTTVDGQEALGMYIEPIFPEFNRVTIRRTGGFAGVDQTLTIDHDLLAKMTCSMTGNRSFALDAFTANELMQALVTFAKERPAASTATGADMFQYDIELLWNGNTYRVHSVDVGADDALHGVMYAANRLMASDYKPPMHIMELHDMPSNEG